MSKKTITKLMCFITFMTTFISCRDNNPGGNTTETNEFLHSRDRTENELNSKPFYRNDIFAPNELKGEKDKPEFKIERNK